MTIAQIAAALGGKRVGRGWMATCPAHHDGTPSLSLSIGRNGATLVHCHAGCTQAAVISALRERGLWNDASAPVNCPTIRNTRLKQPVLKVATTSCDTELTKSMPALAIWQAAGDPRKTAGELYLNRRGLQLPENLVSDVLRFHSALTFDGRRVPGLVALFRDVFTDEPTGIQRVFLRQNGERIGRRMLGRIRGAAIKLDSDADVAEGLHIGEGLESCMAGQALGFRPVWAVGSAGGIRTFPLLPGIEALAIFGETDDRGANEDATRVCAARWLEAGRDVLAITPLLVGDMNDVALRCPHVG